MKIDIMHYPLQQFMMFDLPYTVIYKDYYTIICVKKYSIKLMNLSVKPGRVTSVFF